MDYLAFRGLRLLSWVVAGFLVVGVLGYYVIRDTANYFVENEAVAVADIVVTLSKTARLVYSQEVVKKLQADGTGANPDYAKMHGFVPIPAQFLKMLGQASTANTAHLFQYKPVSKWNIEPTQGLDDDFLRWAWPRLEAQDQANPQNPIAWKPVWRIETQNDARVLRYLVADPAATETCVGCHNAYESSSEVMASRVRQGVAPGKQWQVHQLLGALSVTVPLDRIEILAGQQIRRAVWWIVLILGASFTIVAIALAFGMKQRRVLALASWQASHDALTELANRRGFERALAHFWASAGDENIPHAIIMIDLDGFKPVNDTYGHAVGDEVLKMVAKTLRQHVRASDVAARLGGDEFAVLLHGCPMHQAQEVAETLLSSISEAKLEWEGHRIGVSASIGVAPIDGKSESLRNVIEVADSACYSAKKLGKNRVFTAER